MRIIFTLLAIMPFLSFYSYGMVCLDTIDLNKDIKARLHEVAQREAQEDIELRIGKKMLVPYIDSLGNMGDIKLMMANIEEYWCEGDVSLYRAYYNFYLANRYVFNKNQSL